MTEELERKLYEEFPELFAGRHLPLTQNLMSFGCECDDGWFQIIHDFCEKAKGSGILFVQIKEKFGGLRLYYDFVNDKGLNYSLSADDLMKLSDKAEEESYHICEICGKDAVLCQRGYWLKTLCSDCREKNGYIVSYR